MAWEKRQARIRARRREAEQEQRAQGWGWGVAWGAPSAGASTYEPSGSGPTPGRHQQGAGGGIGNRRGGQKVWPGPNEHYCLCMSALAVHSGRAPCDGFRPDLRDLADKCSTCWLSRHTGESVAHRWGPSAKEVVYVCRWRDFQRNRQKGNVAGQLPQRK